jgi:predicted DNA-binding transcriptional regulator YafY
MRNLTIQSEKFKAPDIRKIKDTFHSTIGLVYSEDPPEKIVLSFAPVQGKYIKSLPLHSSQKIIVDSENEFRIQLFVSPNFELIQLILKHSEFVRVLKPEWLVEEIKSRLQKALNQYL